MARDNPTPRLPYSEPPNTAIQAELDGERIRQLLLGETRLANPQRIVRWILLLATSASGIASGLSYPAPIFISLFFVFVILHSAYLMTAWLQPKLRWRHLRTSGALAEFLMTRISAQELISVFSSAALHRVLLCFLAAIFIVAVPALADSASLSGSPIFFAAFTCSIISLLITRLPFYFGEARFWFVLLSGRSFSTAFVQALIPIVGLPLSVLLALAFTFSVGFSNSSLAGIFALIGLFVWPIGYSFICYFRGRELFDKANRLLASSIDGDLSIEGNSH